VPSRGVAVIERELKLSAGEAFELNDFSGLDSVVATPRPEQRLSTVYFDSDDLRLARWGLSLRYRAGRGWTLKLPVANGGPAIVREELVFEGDPERPPAAAVDLVAGYLRRAELRPQVRLQTLRRGVLLHNPREVLVGDVVDDAVVVFDGQQVIRLGDLAGSASVGEVVTRAIGDGVTRLVRHDPIVRLDIDVEGVHQARVATRRLRSDLRTFPSVLDHEWVASLRTELGWLGGELGAARDADVLLERLTRRAEGLPQGAAQSARTVTDALERQRMQAHAGVLVALRSERYFDLIDRLIMAAQSPALLSGKADRPARKALAPIVVKAWRRLENEVRSLSEPPADEGVHIVRILAKRCRYAAEACAPSLGTQTRELAAAARELQDVLGELNDAVVAERWLSDWATHTDSAEAAFAAGELAALERAAAQRARSDWPKAWKLVKSAEPTG